MKAAGWYSDEWVMRRVGASKAGASGELLWCRVSGQALDPSRRLAISPRTIDVYRARLIRKYAAATTPDLVTRLLSA